MSRFYGSFLFITSSPLPFVAAFDKMTTHNTVAAHRSRGRIAVWAEDWLWSIRRDPFQERQLMGKPPASLYPQ